MYLVVNLHKSDGEGVTGKEQEVEGAAVVGARRRQGARWRQGDGGRAHAGVVAATGEARAGGAWW